MHVLIPNETCPRATPAGRAGDRRTTRWDNSSAQTTPHKCSAAPQPPALRCTRSDAIPTEASLPEGRQVQAPVAHAPRCPCKKTHQTPSSHVQPTRAHARSAPDLNIRPANERSLASPWPPEPPFIIQVPSYPAPSPQITLHPGLRALLGLGHHMDCIPLAAAAYAQRGA